MDGTLQIVSVNQDPGISPGRCKGAAVHLNAMRHAFRQLGARVMEIDESDEGKTEKQLEDIHGRIPISVIYERYALGRSSAARFAMKRNIPYALEVNAPLAEEQVRWRGQTDQEKDASEDRITFGAASFIGAVSSQVAEYARVRGGRSDAICICPNGIDTSRFKIGIPPDGHLSPTLPPGRFVLGFHGRERPWHGFGMLVAVTRELLARNQPVHLFIIGNGEFKDLAQLPSGSYTRTGWVAHEEIPAYVSSFHALPLTYAADMPCYFSPLKLMEGMACGVVPLVPELGDLPVVVNHGVTGLVYPAGDSRVLFEQLIALIADPDLHQQMSVKAASAARAYDWKGIAGTLLSRLGLSASIPRLGKAISR
jgi:glycosyltransferase involved in cell wall biosynthesis